MPPQKDNSPAQQPSHIDSWAQILVIGPRTKQQDEEKRERREERGGPFDTHNNTITNKTPGNGQKQSRQVPTQPTTQEANKDIDGNRVNAGIDVPTETKALESEKRTMTGDEKGKDEGEGKQTSAVQHVQNMERDSSNDRNNSYTNIQTSDEPIAQEDVEPSQPDVEMHAAPPITSPKRSKKLKMDRDTTQAWDRT